MSIRTWFRSSRARRGLAVSILVLAGGGLVLLRAPADARSPTTVEHPETANGANSATFSGPGAHGRIAFSHTHVLAGGERRLFSEITLTADAVKDEAKERAPLSLAVVLDTSGSMAGEKIEQAKTSVISLIGQMRDDDEIALVRYASDSELLQPLSRVGTVRHALIAKVREISAGGGTNIPPALSHGLRTLSDAAKGRVRRVILASDGLDSTRAQAEALARESALQGVTISSLGIGLDFDESYMGGVARAGHGNFAFVQEASALATFLTRELKETAQTTVENATVRLKLPEGVRFVRATGADATPLEGGTEVELRMGSLFSGDERRIIVEMAANLGVGEVRGFEGLASWDQVGGESVQAKLSRIEIASTTDSRVVEEGRDGSVFASATSVFASTRQLEAAEAYARGDTAAAQALIDQNIEELKQAQAAAPTAAAEVLERQQAAYLDTKSAFAKAPPKSAQGKSAAKASVAKDIGNASRLGY